MEQSKGHLGLNFILKLKVEPLRTLFGRHYQNVTFNLWISLVFSRSIELVSVTLLKHITVFIQTDQKSARQQHDIGIHDALIWASTQLESTIVDIVKTGKVGRLGLADASQDVIHHRIDVRILFEDACFLVKGTWLPHLLVVLVADTAINRALDAFSRLRDQVDYTTDGFDHSAEHALANTFAEADDSFFFGAFDRLGHDATDARPERLAEAFYAFTDTIKYTFRLLLDVVDLFLLSVISIS